MKQWVKRRLYSVAPEWTTSLMSARARAHSHRVVAEWGCGPIHRKLVERFGSRVQDGPFAGMVLTPATHAEQIGPYLLGVYESELDPAWDVVLRGSYPQILDVGAKFGYYAVGLAKRYPAAMVVAFDTDPWARGAVREMAAANGLSNIQVKSFCNPDWLGRNTADGALVISDCEGYEGNLFTPGAVAKLRTATLIIETHDDLVPGVCDSVRNAFAQSHDVRTIDGSNRRATALPLDFLTEQERGLACQEVRSAQVWLLCLPRTGPNAALAGRSTPLSSGGHV